MTQMFCFAIMYDPALMNYYKIWRVIRKVPDSSQIPLAHCTMENIIVHDIYFHYILIKVYHGATKENIVKCIPRHHIEYMSLMGLFYL